MRYLVTGAAGFIGSHLVERLLLDGHDVVGVDNFLTGQTRNVLPWRDHPHFQFIEQDVTQPWRLEQPVDVIFNFACPASPIDFHSKAMEILQVCSIGVLNLLAMAKEQRAIYVQASTSECYGDPEVHPQVESYWGRVNPIGERSPYDEGKRFAEAAVMAHHRLYGLEVRIGRIFNTYGPRMRVGDGRVLPNFIEQALSNRPLTIYGEGQQTRSFCYVTDLVDGFIRLSRSKEIKPINLGNPQEMNIREVAQLIIELIGSRSTIAYQPLPADDPQLRQPDIQRARTLLGWEPHTTVPDGFQRTIDYFRTILK
ncbi:MAG: UDP-glucose 4-epimerase [Phycisphaerae bacterium]|nr:UDP-glucose 4-epimerase [Phycisphaerae bacterium]